MAFAAPGTVTACCRRTRSLNTRVLRIGATFQGALPATADLSPWTHSKPETSRIQVFLHQLKPRAPCADALGGKGLCKVRSSERTTMAIDPSQADAQNRHLIQDWGKPLRRP